MSRYYHLVSVNRVGKSQERFVVTFNYDGQMWEAGMQPIRDWCKSNKIRFSWWIDWYGICSMTFRFTNKKYHYMVDLIDDYLKEFEKNDVV